MEHTISVLLKDGDRIAGAFGYERERGRFVVFEAKAVVLATGGIGRAFTITSNSWEYTGDGHALAYDAGRRPDRHGVRAVPPDRHGLAAQRARHPGDRGGARRGRRAAQQGGAALHVRRHPADSTRTQTADNEEEGWRYCQGDKNARRPPELLTRDHVARCIVREVKAGRGSPHGGVFLDISWIKEKIANAPEHIKRKLPSMYHQFKQLADIDITKEPMEVGPTTHYMMGGVRVDAETPDVHRAGPVRGGRVRRRAARRQPAGRQLALRPAGVRQARRRVRGEVRPRERRRRRSTTAAVDAAREAAARPVRAPGEPGAEGPFQIQHELQEMMQDLVGIVRIEEEMHAGAGGDRRACARGPRAVGVAGNREYNPGWHTALDLPNLLTVSEAITRAALERKESRGGHFRDDYPEKDAAFGSCQHRGQQGRRTAGCRSPRVPIIPQCPRS